MIVCLMIWLHRQDTILLTQQGGNHGQVLRMSHATCYDNGAALLWLLGTALIGWQGCVFSPAPCTDHALVRDRSCTAR
jgi:hypothetical protein